MGRTQDEAVLPGSAHALHIPPCFTQTFFSPESRNDCFAELTYRRRWNGRVGQDESAVSGATELSDAWWAKRAKRFLQPIQVEIIEVFLDAGPTRSVRDLGKVFADIEPSKLDVFVGRLRELGALEEVGRQVGVGFMDVRYQLVEDEPPKSAGRTPLAVQFGKNLADCRMRARASYRDLAYSASLREGKISALEEGECEPSVGEVVRLAAALPATINELLGGIRWEGDFRGGGRFAPPDVGDEPAE